MSTSEEMAEDIREAAGEQVFQALIFALQFTCEFANEDEVEKVGVEGDFDLLTLNIVRMILERELDQNPTVTI